jgi:glycosyltransferase involved in cell wall biosynthesis
MNQLRVLHISQTRTKSVGVVKQVEDEQRAANALNIPWRSVVFVPKGNSTSSVCVESNVASNSVSEFRKEFFSWLCSVQDEFDLILLRHVFFSKDELLYLKFFARKRVLTVHHTLEVPEILAGQGFLKYPLACAEALLGYMSLKSIGSVVAVTPEIGEYECASTRGANRYFVYPNGISYDGLSDLVDCRMADIPEFVFVASHFLPWHGLDLLVDSARSVKDKFVINLVGKLTEEQISLVSNDDRFHACGSVNSEKLREIAASAWVGIGSLALFRNNMKQACPLKVREYLASGIPVYAGYQDVFPESFTLYRSGEANIAEMLRFAYWARGMSREDVSVEARPMIDKKNLLDTLYRQLCSEFGGRLS